MTPPTELLLLAHGGTAGGIAELAFVLVPVAVFMVLSRRAAKKTYVAPDEDGAEREAEAGDP